ncbi:MAG: protein translocase subunit SecD [Pseudomonadota bacterium]
MNQYPWWRYALVIVVLVVGALYAAPNLFGTDPALQISARRAAPVDVALQTKITDSLAAANVEPRRIELANDKLLIRFNSPEDREIAKSAIADSLDSKQYVTAVNLAPATPDWLRALGGKPMYMGLDLRGGVHFLMQVDTDAVKQQTDERFISDLKNAMKEEKIRYRTVTRAPNGGILVRFISAEVQARGLDLIDSDFVELKVNEQDTAKELEILLTPTEEYLIEARRTALKQNLTTLRKRVNELGVAEPVIQQQGDSRIVIQLPGVEDSALAKDIIGATATLEFRMVFLDGDAQEAAAGGKVPVSARLYEERDGTPILLNKRVMLEGKHITNAASSVDTQNGGPIVRINLDGEGGKRFSKATGQEIGKPMATVFIEQVKGRAVEEVINVATIRDQLAYSFQISGLESSEEARNLALLLRAGALAAPIEIIEERTVGPTLGADNIKRGFDSVKIGLLLVLIFMALYYKVFGLVADLALVANIVLIVSLLSMLQATLTLPGIAGIVLTVGMAVDANVLIFQRIKEELKNGNSPQASIHAGYEKAFSTIADANITTLIAAIVLFSFGTGPIKGFAVTLSLGIITSMFTAIIGTRAVVNLIYGNKRLEKLAI